MSAGDAASSCDNIVVGVSSAGEGDTREGLVALYVVGHAVGLVV